MKYNNLLCLEFVSFLSLSLSFSLCLSCTALKPNIFSIAILGNIDKQKCQSCRIYDYLKFPKVKKFSDS